MGIKPGLERIQALLSLLGDPQLRIPSVHIAGTNGKGSVTALLSRILQETGLQVGVFTSPHLHSYNERFRINDRHIEDRELWELVEEISPFVNRMEPGSLTEFEILTAVAFVYFARHNVDIMVLETGMGGIYDSTNVVTPLISVITNVGLDHVQYLGPELADVAGNKAGIIKPGVPAIYGGDDPVVRSVLQERAASVGAPFYEAGALAEVKVTDCRGMEGWTLDYSIGGLTGHGVKFNLPGRYQLENLTTSLAAVVLLLGQGLDVRSEQLNRALDTIRWPGRLEQVLATPRVIVDAAHNLHGTLALRRALEEIFPGVSRVIVAGILDDKDSAAMFAALAPGTRRCIVTRPDGPRGKGWMARYREAAQVFADPLAVESIEDAVKTGLNLVRANEYLLICGSFMTLDRARKMFTQT